MRNKKIIGFALCTMLFVPWCAAEAQQTLNIPRIGYVAPLSPAAELARIEPFRQGLRDLGYIEGKTILVDFRFAEGKRNRIPSLMAELVQRNMDILVSEGLRATRAAKKLTNKIPIISVTSADLVAAGLVDRLARPGGNVTGLTRLTRDLSGKRLQLFKELVPGLSRVGVLLARGTTTESAAMGFEKYEIAAQTLRMDLQLQEVRAPELDFAGVFEAFTREGAQGVIVSISPLIRRYSKTIVDLALKNRLPSMYEASNFVEAGGLTSYSTDDAEVFRRAATYVDKILKGAKPSKLPVERPTKFEFVINLKAAKQIGLKIPPNVLARADRVIR